MCNACEEAACDLLRRRTVLIQISRTVRVALSGEELQTLHSGEFYEVMPAVGLVLVADGWAVEAVSHRRDPADHLETADDAPDKDGPGS
jgi:hypothetical protein